MTFYEFIDKINQLKKENKVFSIAIVTGRKAPISGKRGDKAIILENGQIMGWIGGGCTQSVVVVEAKKAMKDGKSRVIRISPEKVNDPLPGVIEYNMTCHSGGDIEVYVEPILPQPQLIIVGKSVVAQTLAKLGKVLDYSVSVIAPEISNELFPTSDELIEFDKFAPENLKLSPYNYIIISTQGERDEEAFEKMLPIGDIPYISFVASRKKAKAVFEYLESAGFTKEQIERIKVPAGIDINAKSPKEVALSILAEIVQVTRDGLEPIEVTSTTSAKATPSTKEVKTKEMSDEDQKYCPTCDMIAKPQNSWEYNGQTYYFCCQGCERAFKKNPESFLTAE